MSKTLYIIGEESGGGLHTLPVVSRLGAHHHPQCQQSRLVTQRAPHCPVLIGAGSKGEEATSTVKAEAKSKAKSFMLRFKTNTLLRFGFL